MRGRKRTPWVKFWVTGWLHGSIRWQLSSEERGIWADLLCLAGECSKGGKICDNDGRAYPHQFIANQLNVPLNLLERTIVICQNAERIKMEGDVMVIANWDKYQSEYDRTRPYREAKKREDPDKYVSGEFGEHVNR